MRKLKRWQKVGVIMTAYMKLLKSFTSTADTENVFEYS